MRRALSIVLLATFVLQTTGSLAAKSVVANIPPFHAELGAAILGAVQAIEGSQAYALLIGTEDRYSAMHATPPDFSHLTRHRQANLALLRANEPLTGKITSGVRVPLPTSMTNMRPPRFAASDSAHPSSPMLHSAPTPSGMAKPAGAPIRLSPAKLIVQSDVNSNNPSTTGINPYWQYEEGTIPGAGSFMVNVANGNLVVEGDDIDIPERGIDLTFSRMYNSNSGHDWDASDGSTMGNYGGGWTNNLDSHLGYDSSRNVISWYDIDGGRYDFACSGTACTAPAGQHATMTYDNGCGYWITKKSGTAYHFVTPVINATIAPLCTWGASMDGYLGRVITIWARNQNNNLQFTYSWDGGDSSSASHLAQMVVQHSDGQALTLTFGDVNNQRVLLSILEPNGQSVRYGYDSAIELSDVCTPGNGNTDNSPGAAEICGDTTHIHHRYGYSGGDLGHQIAWADSPKWTMSWGASASNGFVNFGYDASSRLATVDLMGIFNFTPDDGTGVLLQPDEPTGTQELTETSYVYGAEQTNMTDTDGHAAIYTWDDLGRVTQRQAWQGTMYLVGRFTWDADNNLSASVDTRGYETDYVYDANGNVVAMALPATTTANQGTFRPTTLYSYDRTNNASNLVAECDPVQTQALGLSWVSPPTASDALCPATDEHVTRLFWVYPAYEPFGELHALTSPGTTAAPAGYTKSFSYIATLQAGNDYGLPTSVTSPTFSENDGSTPSQEMDLTYDGLGNVACSSTLTDGGAPHWEVRAYDSLNRVVAEADADDASLTSAACSKSPGLPGSHIAHTRSYNADGSVASTQVPSEYATGVHSSVAYDADGNVLTTTSYAGGVQSTATNVYDGADRLVETDVPSDQRAMPDGVAHDYYTFDFKSRYIYGLDPSTQAQTFYGDGSVPIHEYGNLWEIEQYLGTGSAQDTASWTPVSATGYDSLDRTVSALRTKICPDTIATGPQLCSATVENTSTTYDASGDEGLEASTTNPTVQTKTLSYTSLGQVLKDSYSDSTPSETFGYDGDGRAVTMQSSTFGTQTYAYDAAAEVTQVDEPDGGTVLPAAISYTYYPDGKRAGLSAAPVSGGSTLFSEQFAYRGDGKQIYSAMVVGTSITAFQREYTAGGRLESVASTPANSSFPEQITFDNYGRVASYALPAQTYSGLTYDQEGELLGGQDSYPQQPQNDTTIAYTYSTRGELGNGSDYGGNSGYHQSANGVLMAAGNAGAAPTSTWDGRDAATMAGLWPTAPSFSTSKKFSYDVTGRMTGETTVATSPYLDPDGNPCSQSSTTTIGHVFDAENHTVSTSSLPFTVKPLRDCGGPPKVTYGQENQEVYGWGPAGHPLTLAWSISNVPNPSSGTEGLHWDGANLLFTSNANGLGRVFLQGDGYEQEGVFIPTPRDASGRTIDQSFADSPFDSNPNDLSPFSQIQPNSDFVIDMPRGDGINTGLDTIQGVRDYNKDSTSWTTPDAYAGEPSDPMSLQKYMWNGNNPMGYSDPSGFRENENSFGNMFDWTGVLQQTISTITTEEAKAEVQKAVDSDKTNGHYKDKVAVVKWLKDNLAPISMQTTDKVEIGCEIYCNSGGCGYRNVNMGDSAGVDINYNLDAAGQWHTHTLSKDHDSFALGHHMEETSGFFLRLGISVFTVYTTVSDGSTWGEDYRGIGDVDDPPEPYAVFSSMKPYQKP